MSVGKARRPIRITLPRRRLGVDAALPLINVVFLLLVFLLTIGSVRAPLPGGISVARSFDVGEPAETSDALVLSVDGAVVLEGRTVVTSDLPALLGGRRQDGKPLTVVADRAMPADRFLLVAQAIADGGIETISLVTRNE